jgi:Flp pilus assembly protein TadB
MVTPAPTGRRRGASTAPAAARPKAARRVITRACAVLACAGALLGLSVGPAGAASAPSRGSHRTLMILLDNNSDNTSGNDWLAMARRAALAYAGALPSDVRAGLVTFAGQWQLVLRPTTDRARLQAAVGAVAGAGGSFYNSGGIYAALAGVTSAVPTLRGPGGRLVVISDAENLTGAGPTATIPTHVIAQRVDDDDFIGKLRGLASGSGGRMAGPGRAAALGAAAYPAPQTHPSAAGTHRAQAKPHAPAGGAARSWPWALLAGVAALFTALFIVTMTAFASVARAGRDRDLEERIERYGPRHKPTAANDEATGAARVHRAAQSVTQRLMSPAAQERLAERLELAGIARKPAEWALLGGCLGIVVAGALSLVTSYVLVGVLAGALIGWLAMRLSLSFRIVRRRAAFADQLPDVLQLVASTLQSGFSLPQALDAVVREDAQPVAGEFSRALAESRLGGDLEDGLEAAASRMDSDDLHWAVVAIRVQQGVGGNLAEVLLTIAGTIRERAFLRRQVRALSAEGRLSAYVLVTLPVLLGIWLFISRPQYMRLFYTTHVGEIMLVAAIGLTVVGALWMRKMIKIEI